MSWGSEMWNCLRFCLRMLHHDAAEGGQPPPPNHSTDFSMPSCPVLMSVCFPHSTPPAVVEGLAGPGKRAHTSLSSAMAGLGLSQQQAAAPADATQQGQQEPAEVGAQPAARRQRYRRLSTLSAAQLKAMDASQLSSLLASGSSSEAAAQQAQRRTPIKGGLQPAGGGTAERAAGARQAGAAARYEQIRRRRGLSNFSITEQAADPLEGLAAVVDLVAYPQDGSAAGTSDAGNGSSGARASSGFGGPQPQRPSRAQRAAQQYDEGTLMCNYLPMVREYLASQGKADLPLPGSQAGVAPGADPMAADAAAEEEGDADEYVYDLYAAVSEDEAGGEGQREAWQELHASGHAPVVQVGSSHRLAGLLEAGAGPGGRLRHLKWAPLHRACCCHRAAALFTGWYAFSLGCSTPPCPPTPCRRSSMTTRGWCWRDPMLMTVTPTPRTRMPRDSTHTTTQVGAAGRADGAVSAGQLLPRV